jgi:hypothetical protein
MRLFFASNSNDRRVLVMLPPRKTSRGARLAPWFIPEWDQWKPEIACAGPAIQAAEKRAEAASEAQADL